MNDKDSDRRRKTDPVASGEASKERQRRRRQSPEVGTALRSVYQRTIDEAIPIEMLDLLGKLD